ncbi:MAG: hypothetical protein WCX12_02120 [Candidatus Paceibacterota bacterium]|jgi:hypothetical protein
MNKKSLVIVLVVLIVGFGAYYIKQNQAPVVFDPLNATYILDDQPVTLTNGKSEVSAAPGSATEITTTIFGEPVTGDLNSDGKPDAAIILVDNPGGTGTFYFVAAAINTHKGAQGTNAVLLGDRIAPQNIQIKNGQIIANYTDRGPDDPMSVPPSIGVSKYLVFDGTGLKSSPPISGAGERCGGNMKTTPICITDYHCTPNPNSDLPFGDVGGTCVLDVNQN